MFMKKLFLLFISLLLAIGLFSQIVGKVDFTETDLVVEPQGEFVKLLLPNSISKSEIGTPELPYIIQSFVIPINATVTGVRINSIIKKQILGSYYICPEQLPMSIGGEHYDRIFRMDTVLYNSNLPFPNPLIKIITDEYEMGYHIVTIGVCPIEYIPLKREVYLCNIDFSIEYTTTLQKRDLTESPKQSQIQKDLVTNHIKALVENPEDVEKLSPSLSIVSQSKGVIRSVITKSSSVVDEIVPMYIIITNNELKPIFEDLANWKTKKGVPSIIKTTEEIIDNYPGVDIPEKIRNYLIEVRSRWGVGLFILLGGNTDIIPARFVKGASSSTADHDWPTDLYYATTKGTWYNENARSRFSESSNGHDFYLGRAPVKTKAEAENFIKKILLYEKADIPDKNYYNNSLIATGFLDRTDCKEYYTPRQDQIRYSQYKNKFKQYKNGIPDNIKNNTVLMFDNHTCSGNAYVYREIDPYCQSLKDNSLRTIHTPEQPYSSYCITGDYEFNKENFLSAFNSAQISGRDYFHTIFHLDHSGINSIGASSKDKGEQVTKESVAQLNNGNYLQIMYSFGCEPATFSYDCFGTKYLNNPNGGGVAFIGNSDVGWYHEHPDLNNFYKALYNENTPFNIGYVFRNTPLSDNSGKRRLTLLGDPEMQVWTNTPQNLDVRAKVIASVAGKITVSVKTENTPKNGATLCIMKGADAYMVDIITDTLEHIFNINSYTNDSLYVTVTAHNYIPKEIRVADPTQYNTNISIKDLIFDDDKSGKSVGNGDGILGAGESIELTVKLKNTGVNRADSVTATLRCESPYISMIDSVASYGNISSNGEGISLVKYVFRINENTPDISKKDDLINDPITFRLDIKDVTDTIYSDQFNIDVSSPKIKQGNQTVYGQLTAGSTVELLVDLFNNGKAEATGITTVLKSDNPYVSSIAVSASNYSGIKFKETKQNLTNYKFTISGSYPLNSPLNMILETKNEFGKKDTLRFNLLDRPSGDINTLSFVGEEKNIKLTWQTSDATVAGYNIYRSNSSNGTFTRLNTFLVPYAYFMDYNLHPLTKYYYKVSAVSASGNEGALSNVIETWTTTPNIGQFPIATDINIAMKKDIPMNIYDINNDGKKEIFTGITGENSKEGFLIGIKADGTDLFDLDRNVTSHSGFADLQAKLQAPMAIGDLFGTGENQIVSITRETNTGNSNYITVYSVNDLSPKDERPDIVWQEELPENEYYYSAPVLANLDNSSDGSLEIILHADYSQKIKVLSNNGSVLWEKDIPNDDWNISSLSVADLNDDGTKEIILGSENGVYIFDHNGNDYKNKNPFYSRTGYSFTATPVIADINNDGEKDIIIRANKKADNKINVLHVINNDGQLFNNWGTNQSLMTVGVSAGTYNPFSVGDLNRDGLLEIVALGRDTLKIWNSNGETILTKYIKAKPLQSSGSDYSNNATPILGDLDIDDQLEILIASNNEDRIYGINMDGTLVAGFPIIIPTPSTIDPALSDINNDGKTDIIISIAGDIYAWSTDGDANKIDWGSVRANSQNTGEYRQFCEAVFVNESTIWDTQKDICGNVIIESGATLTLKSNCILNMKESTLIIVKANGILNIDGAKIYGTNIKALELSTVYLQNNGYIELSKNGNFDIQKGSIFNYVFGIIDPKQ